MENNTTHHTPTASVIGALLIAAGLFIVLIALGEKTRAGIIAGAAVTVIGIIAVMIGRKHGGKPAAENEPANGQK